MKFYDPNSKEVSLKLEKNKEYFDSLFKGVDDNIILDEQQRIAVALDLPNLLVIAGAGSGKTTTMVAKVKYLIDKCGYKESEIAVLSFTKKVEEELKRLIHNGFGYRSVTISTFHALGLKIINAGGYNYEGIVDDAGQYKILSGYIKNVLFKDKEKFLFFLEAFSRKLYFNSDWENFETFEDYHNYRFNNKLKKSNSDIGKYNQDQINSRLKYRKTINGEYLRSKEEVNIANFLFLYGINYKYEKKYDKTGEIKTYYPDFYINQLEKENYIEHFGIDEDGHNDMYTEYELESYLKTLNIKKSFFREDFNKDLFIVTYSKYNNEQTYIEALKHQLISKGYTLEEKTAEEVYNRLRDTSQDGYYANYVDRFLIPVIASFKRQNYHEEDFDKLICELEGDLKKQIIVLKDFFNYYQNELKKLKKIDFEDMIYKAHDLMEIVKEKELGVDFKYLIIDEYQDISRERLDFVRRMADLFDAKVMAVGDDWQTIFGYSGSKIDIFKSFEEEMEDAKSVPIEKTYRNSQELIDIAGEFILKNEDQIEKRLTSDKSIKNPVYLCLYDDTDKSKLELNRSIILAKIIDVVNKIDNNSNLLLLGRYKKDIYKIKNEDLFKVYSNKIESKKYKDMKIDFLTIHQAKGLGYDNCVLLDLSDETYGFPSQIEDEPIIKLIEPKISESIDYPEERRLFYVALTRTKNRIFMLVPKSKASIFAKEIIKYVNVKTQVFD